MGLGLTSQWNNAPQKNWKGAPKGGLKSRFHAGFSDKLRPEIAWNSCSRQVYPITLDADFSRNHAIILTQFTFSRYEICPITPSPFSLGGPLSCPGTIFLESCSITIVLKEALRRDQNTSQAKEENMGSGKSKIVHGKYAKFFHWKDGSNTPQVASTIKVTKLESKNFVDIERDLCRCCFHFMVARMDFG